MKPNAELASADISFTDWLETAGKLYGYPFSKHDALDLYSDGFTAAQFVEWLNDDANVYTPAKSGNTLSLTQKPSSN